MLSAIRRQRRILGVRKIVEEETLRRAPIVDPFRTQHQRTSCENDTIPVGFDRGMTLRHADRHRQS